jgi:hypothetical protein
MYLINKKAQAMTFLIELLLLIGFIYLVFTASSTLLSNEGKFRALDVKNTQLFIERIPSIEGNFEYELVFGGEYDVKIEDSKVSLDTVGREEHRYFEPLNTPYAFEYSFENVSSLFIYKSGDQVLVTKKKKKDLTLLLRKPSRLFDVSEIEIIETSGANFIPTDGITEWDFIQSATNLPVVIFLESSKIYPQDSVLYTQPSKAFATNVFNSVIHDISVSANKVPIAFIPTNSYDEIFSALKKELVGKEIVDAKKVFETKPLVIIIPGEYSKEQYFDSIRRYVSE